ncbi:hypothetical protein EC912_107101 [Luteibacter rhizovicinus]|uniref:Uncharacterized protein n=1 Tax=Luteibacter rhizovicinus TaxID=242606 RepID=A0A4R3YNE6_9GAMM|nr:hypothetical protein EC912_107101 [Luteibacter rhizovicinus]
MSSRSLPLGVLPEIDQREPTDKQVANRSYYKEHSVMIDVVELPPIRHG